MAPNFENWPSDWGKPTKEMIAVIEEAVDKFEIPENLLYSLIRKESNFNPKLRGYKHAGNSETFAASYEKYKGVVIPGSNPKKITWGQMFPKPRDWTPYGLCQLMPYHVVGKTGGVKPGASLSELYKVAPNIRLSCSLLAALHKKYPDSWGMVLVRYNGAKSYAIQVAGYMSAFNQSQGVA